jgi:hypothetical protein
VGVGSVYVRRESVARTVAASAERARSSSEGGAGPATSKATRLGGSGGSAGLLEVLGECGTYLGTSPLSRMACFARSEPTTLRFNFARFEGVGRVEGGTAEVGESGTVIAEVARVVGRVGRS